MDNKRIVAELVSVAKKLLATDMMEQLAFALDDMPRIYDVSYARGSKEMIVEHENDFKISTRTPDFGVGDTVVFEVVQVYNYRPVGKPRKVRVNVRGDSEYDFDKIAKKLLDVMEDEDWGE